MTHKGSGPLEDSKEYLARKAHFKQFMTIYGRNAVHEALVSRDVNVAKLHVAHGAKGKTVKQIIDLAEEHGVEIVRASKEQVSRISRNGRQDQGIVADLRLTGYGELTDFLNLNHECTSLIALDGITTPANVGMIIRSSVAGGIDGVIIPEKGCCSINPMVVKASAGTAFKARILRSAYLAEGIAACRDFGYSICALAGGEAESIFDFHPPKKVVYVLGSEGEGVSSKILDLADHRLTIPMADGVESLNVAVAASLVAYRQYLAVD